MKVTKDNLLIPNSYPTEVEARQAGQEWLASADGQDFAQHHCEPGAVLYTYNIGSGWDWAVRSGNYTLTSHHLTDGYTLDIFTDAASLSGWLGMNGVTGDTVDLIRRAVLGTLPLVSENPEEQALLFRLLLTLAPRTPDWVINTLMDDPSDVVSYHAMNRALSVGADAQTVQKAHDYQLELQEAMLDLLLDEEH